MTLWGGRFEEGPDEALWNFTVDHVDRRLLRQDVVGSIAHVKMLVAVELLSESEGERLLAGLVTVLDEAQQGSFAFSDSDEDVHSAVERRLYELIGELAGKLHTGRSRNDQVCLDLRLYLSEAARARIQGLAGLVAVLRQQAIAVGERIGTAHTHLQPAQAVPLAHLLLAYAWMLRRDAERFKDMLPRIEVSPLGAGAAGGSSLPLDPAHVARSLGWPAVFENSVDAVASRDFAAEYGFACAQAMVHLSRMGEEMILWASEPFGWLVLPDRFATGSSALPQKKNPDIAELARGKSARAIGSLTTLLALQKGLPLAYNRDLQEDKAALFAADDALATALPAMSGMLAGAIFQPQPPSAWVTALDLAERLVSRGMPFRDAHHAVGRLVSRLLDEGRDLSDLDAAALVALDPVFEPDDVAVLSPAASVEARQSARGGHMDSVGEQIEALGRWLDAIAMTDPEENDDG